jgi:hypothetical protein
MAIYLLLYVVLYLLFDMGAIFLMPSQLCAWREVSIVHIIVEALCGGSREKWNAEPTQG